MSKRAIWNVTIGCSGLVYLLLVFCRNIQSPLFAAIFVAAAGYEVVGSHTPRHKP